MVTSTAFTENEQPVLQVVVLRVRFCEVCSAWSFGGVGLQRSQAHNIDTLGPLLIFVDLNLQNPYPCWAAKLRMLSQSSSDEV